VEEGEVADCIRRVLRHRELNTRAKRVGCVIRASPSGITLWRLRNDPEIRFPWRLPSRRP
jgi:hypothetical protein